MENLFGWTGTILKVDLTERKIATLSTSDYNDRFLGGLGIGAKIYWDESSPELDAFDPDNPLIFMTGPLAGTPVPSASRVVVCGKSPSLYPETFVWASLGGFFAVALKKAGYDGIVVKGKADKPVYINIENSRVEIKDACHLWGQTNTRTRLIIKEEVGGNPSMMSIGPGAECGTRIGNVITDISGSASTGFGSVMGSKNLKAIAANGTGKVSVASPEKLERIKKKLRVMTGEGYFHLFGSPTSFPGSGVKFVKKAHCHGCARGCWRSVFRAPSGEEGVRECVAAGFYKMFDMQLHEHLTEASFLGTALINDYSLCAIELLSLFLWLSKCYRGGMLSEEDTGLPLSQMGSMEFLRAVVDKVSLREGFGAVLGEGALRAAMICGKESEIMRTFLTQTGRPQAAYSPRVFITSTLVYATEPRPFIAELHEICEPLTKWAMWYLSKGKTSYVSTDVLRKIGEKFWGSEKAVDFSTHEGKALAAMRIQNRQLAKESLILCDFAYPVFDDARSKDHVGDPSIESQLLSAVSGREVDERGLQQIGERISALDRAILLREGRRGREDDILSEHYFSEAVEPVGDVFSMRNPELFLPGKGDEIISRKGKAVDREKFEQIKSEYYKLRGWDVTTGFMKKGTLEKLNLEDVAFSLDKKVI